MKKKAYDIGESTVNELAQPRRQQTHSEEQQGVTKMIRTEPQQRSAFTPKGFVALKGSFINNDPITGYWGQIDRVEDGQIVVHMNDNKTYRFKTEDADQHLVWLGNNSPKTSQKTASSWYNKYKEC